MDYSTSEINFLDVTVENVCDKLETDSYWKPHDKHQHLHAQSWHRKLYKISMHGERMQGLKEFIQ